jgi:hypothetical protein
LAGSNAERRDRGLRELQRERFEHAFVRADEIVPLARLLVRLKGRR